MEEQVRHPAPGVLTGLTIAALLLTALQAAAQDVTEPALKAAFIYNFAKFTDWPADAVPARAPLVICVLGDAAVGVALEEGLKGRSVGDHVLTVRQVMAAESNRGCHLLYVSGVAADRAADIVAGVRDAPVLTMSDVEEFTVRGGIARLFFEHGRLRFSVHAGAAKRAGLQISSQLLALSKPERGHDNRGRTP